MKKINYLILLTLTLLTGRGNYELACEDNV
jgi:hypothetical protein